MLSLLVVASCAGLVAHAPMQSLRLQASWRGARHSATPVLATAAAIPMPPASIPPLVAAPKTNKLSRFVTGLWFSLTAIFIVCVAYIPLIPITLWSLVFDNAR